MEYYFKPAALRDFKKLSKSIQKRIIEKMEFYVKLGRPLEFAEVLKDKTLGEFRFRIGDYRVIFDVESKRKIIILTIGHRRDIYR